MPSTTHLSLHGIVPPMVTPLLDYDTLHIDGLERLIEHIPGGGGVHGSGTGSTLDT